MLLDREQSINIAVVDLKIPGMDGLKLVRRLRQDPARDIQCIMVSDHGTMGDIQQAMHEHVREFQTKPQFGGADRRRKATRRFRLNRSFDEYEHSR